MMSRSLCPCCSFSLIWFRRSFARSASDSAIVWFWHTRQRNSAAIAITRSGSPGSAAAGAASFAHAAPPSSSRNASASVLPTIGPRRERDALLDGGHGRGLRIPRGGDALPLSPAARREAISAVARREQAAQRHQQGAAPDPVDERLLLREVTALRGIKHGDALPRTGHLQGRARRYIIRSRHIGDAAEAEDI